MTAHSILPPSGAGRWVKCHGSIKMQQLHPLDDETEDSREGTAAHWVNASVLGMWGSVAAGVPSAYDFVGRKAPNGVIITTDMADACSEFINEVLLFCNKNGGLRQIVIEEAVSLAFIHPDMWGTPDLWHYDPVTQTLTVFDYKHGHKYVSAVGNYQQGSYALGVWAKLHAQGKPVAKFKLVIVQPRCYHYSGTVRTWTPDANELLDMQKELSNAAHQALGTSPCTTTGSHCYCCTAELNCEAAILSSMAALEYSRNVGSYSVPDKDFSVMHDFLSRAIETLKLSKTALEVEARARLQKGKRLPGMSVIDKHGLTVWDKPVPEVFKMGDELKIELRKPPAAITPKQAITKGANEVLVNLYSSAPVTGFKVINDKGERAKQIFSKIGE